MKLVLFGLYNSRNVPKNLISAHSVVLVNKNIYHFFLFNEKKRTILQHILLNTGRRDTEAKSAANGRKATEMSKGASKSSGSNYERIYE